MNNLPKPELSKIILVETLKDTPKIFELVASEEERMALALRYGILSVDTFSAKLSLTLHKNKFVRLEGTLTAQVTQSCVVTLEPVESLIEVSFNQIHGGSEDPEKQKEIEYTLDSAEFPEPFVEGAIDIGEVAAERLAEELEPFPRKPEACFKGYENDDGDPLEPKTKNRPFANLNKLIKERK